MYIYLLEMIIMYSIVDKVNTLVEALPYIQQFSGKTIVIKYGGSAMLNQKLSHTIMQDITLLKYVGVNPIIVHGGGPKISEMLSALDIKTKFHSGLRITDAATMEVVEMVLAGKINTHIVTQINQVGGHGIGLSGKDANLIEVKQLESKEGIDYGYVGDIVKVNCEILDLLAKAQYIPVIAPIGIGADGQSYNINADTAAGELAAALKAEKLIFLTDTDGVLMDSNDPSSIISVLPMKTADELIAAGIISNGMIPKVLSSIRAVEAGVNSSHIINGTIEHPLLLEIFTVEGIGTMVTR